MTNLVTEIEARLAENKSSVKTYASFGAAHKVGEKLGSEFNAVNGTDVPVMFIPVFLPETKRWSVVFNLTSWSTKSGTGTYLGWFAQKGFFSI